MRLSIDDFAAHVQAGAARSATCAPTQPCAAGSFVRCLLNLLMQHASEPQLADHAAAARAAWHALGDADPAGGARAKQQPDSLVRLALRLPWRGDGLAPIGKWLVRMPSPADAAPVMTTSRSDQSRAAAG